MSPKDVDVLTPSPCELGNGVFADDCDAGMTVGSRPRGLVSFQKGDIWAQRPAEERPHVDPGRGQRLQKDPRPPRPRHLDLTLPASTDDLHFCCGSCQCVVLCDRSPSKHKTASVLLRKVFHGRQVRQEGNQDREREEVSRGGVKILLGAGCTGVWATDTTCGSFLRYEIAFNRPWVHTKSRRTLQPYRL